MRVVITGGSGFIGRHLVSCLLRHGVEVLGVGQEERPVASQSGCRYHCSDLRDPGTLLPPDDPGGPFALIHLAWDTSRSPSYQAHAAHVARLAGLLDHWAPRGLARVLVAGSAEEYGQRGGLLSEDSSPEGRLTPYGWGKRAAAELTRSWAEASGVTVFWLRPMVVYGPGQQGSMVVPYALRQARAGQRAEFTEALQLRDFVHVTDVCEAFRAALAVPATGWQALNLGTGQPVAVRTVLDELAGLLGAHGLFHYGALPRRPGEPDVQAADPRRAAAVLGWASRVPWREGIRHLVQCGEGAISWAA